MNEWNRNNLELFFDDKGTGLVYFYTPMCGTCQLAGKMLRVVEELVNTEMGKMNLNFYPDLAEQFRIESVPCLLFVKKGEVIETLYAFHSIPYLLERIQQNFH
ncbi:thioredoxin family protein [Neobacillus dielmonensis]|uniref:thioredoxin family protein n=1 Tax=Neobacillus dielmonensis TaxID=1347369 RepID=UPI0005AB7825|nr:thioredoxin family protein [Neobacillus dielmonensis]